MKYSLLLKGKLGRARVSYDGWVGWTTVQPFADLLNAQQYTDFKIRPTKRLTAGTTTSYFACDKPDANGAINTRWYDYVYRAGFSHSNSINVSRRHRIYQLLLLSVGYTDQEGIVRKMTLSVKHFIQY